MPPSAPPSARLRGLNLLLRHVAKPKLARTATPQIARAEFAHAARLAFRRPPFLLRRRLPQSACAPELHSVTAGPVRPGALILYFHGGAYFAGSPATHEALAGRLSRLTAREVILPDYRLVPEHPAPAAFEDAFASHAALIARGHRPGDIVLAGDSAGAGIALALLAELCRRDLRPAALVAFSPWADLSKGSASQQTNAAADPLLPVSRLDEVVAYVLGSAPGALSPTDPRVSPVHARFDRPPPALIQMGDTEILRDDAVRVAARMRQGGGAVELSQWQAVPHAWQILDGYVPEARAALVEAAEFIDAVLSPRNVRVGASPSPARQK
ncbi:MAG: alpha/beta hydrolase [Pseudomonadota bacterium]